MPVCDGQFAQVLPVLLLDMPLWPSYELGAAIAGAELGCVHLRVDNAGAVRTPPWRPPQVAVCGERVPSREPAGQTCAVNLQQSDTEAHTRAHTA